MEPFIHKDEKNTKQILLGDLRKTIKLIRESTDEGTVLGNDTCLAQSLSHFLDLNLRHGLRDAHKGYWPLVQQLTHSATRQIINSLTRVHSPLGKGRAWLHLTLSEGSLDSYLQCLSRDKHSLHKHYAAHALLRDLATLQQLLALVAGLQHVQFNLDADVCYLDMSTYKHPTMLDTQSTSLMTSSLTSSLASPVDSGVALLDSDIDATSVSDATFSMRDDDSMSTEMDDQDIEITDTLLMTMSNTQTATEAMEAVQNTQTENMEHLITGDPVRSKLFKEPVLLEAVLLKAQDEKSYDKTILRSATDMEKALLHDASSHFLRKAMLLNPHIQVEKVDAKNLELCAEKLPRKGNETVASLEVNSVYTMTASDIANQNIAPLSGDVVAHMANISIGTCPVGTDGQFSKEDQVATEPTDCDEIVYRRHRKKKPKSEVKAKRVSFHEDLIFTPGQDNLSTRKQADSSLEATQGREGGLTFSASFLPPNAILKKDATKGRYSWCGEGDAPYVSLRPDSSTRSDVYLSSSNAHEQPSEQSKPNLQTVVNAQNVTCKNVSREPAKLSEGNVRTMREHNSSCGGLTRRYRDMDSTAQFDGADDTMLQMDSLLPSTKPAELKRYSPGGFLSERGTPAGLLSERGAPGGFLLERGAPEGQEDPQRTSSNLQLFASSLSFPSMASSVDCYSDVESVPSDFGSRRRTTRMSSLHGSFGKLSSIDSRFGGKRNSIFDAKRSLLNRFLKLVTMKKFIGKRSKIVKVSRSMYIKGVKRNDDLNKEFTSNLNCEIEVGKRDLPVYVGYSIALSADMNDILKNRIFANSSEVLYKAYKIRSCYFTSRDSTPLLILLTDLNLYVSGVKDNYVYCNHLVLSYNNLDSVLVGPNCQTVLLVSKDGTTQFLVATADVAVTQEMVAHIELAVRRCVRHSRLNVRCLHLEEMASLRHSLVQEGAILKDDRLQHYSLVHLQDNQASPPSTPLGPTKEGHLMYRQASEAATQQWAPGYFILKAGVVYIFEDQGHRLPKHVVMLRNGHCKGCRRLVDRRPYTFEVSLSRVRSVQFAASDEYQASDWLQAFVQAASGVYEQTSVDTTPCSLVLSTSHIVACREQFPSGSAKAVAVARIGDLSAFRAEHSWCVLEFACREVHETSGDWIVYFASVAELEAFEVGLRQLWSGLKQAEFPLSGIAEPHLVARCMETGQLLSEAWDQLLSSN